MKEQTDLIYPTVDLFLYDLRNGLNDDAAEISRNREQFWSKIDAQINSIYFKKSSQQKVVFDQIWYDQRLKELTDLENPEADYALLEPKQFQAPQDGHYFPVQLGDTYALQVNCSGLNEKQNINSLHTLKHHIVCALNHHDVKTEIEADKQGTIGQTWLVWGQIANGNVDVNQLARDCYNKLTPNAEWNPNFKEHGKFLGGTIFEYWHLPTNWHQEWYQVRLENYHLIILLFPPGESIAKITKKVREINFDLIRLFCDRHKILFAYWQSRYQKSELEQIYTGIKTLIEQGIGLSKNLKNFTRSSQLSQSALTRERISLNKLELMLIKYLPTLADYTIALNDLDAQLQTMKINLENYQQRVEKLEEETGSDLSLLKNFSIFVDKKYREQLESERNNLAPGLKLLENVISMIGGIITIEQTRSDRNLTITIGCVGAGLAASSITTHVMIVNQPPPENTFFVLTPVFYTSIMTGAIASLSVWFLLKLLRW